MASHDPQPPRAGEQAPDLSLKTTDGATVRLEVLATHGTAPRTAPVISGLIKGAVFGFIVATMGCFYGMQSGRGAQGVGRATKSAVVAASVLILAANYILTELFFSA